MISYEPLLKTLQEKKIPFDELNEKVNGGTMLRSSLNKGKYIPLEMVDLICQSLDIPVEKVILYRKGEQPSENKIKVNWDKLSEKAKANRYGLSALSQYCRLDPSYLSQSRKRNSMIPEKVLEVICKKLNCTVDDLKMPVGSADAE